MVRKLAEVDKIPAPNPSRLNSAGCRIFRTKSAPSFNNTNVALIAGGRDKNTDLKEFCQAIKEHIKTVILIGEAAGRFENNLKENEFNNIIFEKTIESAIDKAIELNPNVVLLSPACASFDMFNSYEHRGEDFKEYVLSKN